MHIVFAFRLTVKIVVMAVLAMNERDDAISVYSAVRCREQQNDTVSYTPVGRDVSRFQQLTSPTDTPLTGFDVIFSNTHHHYSRRSHFSHINYPRPRCVHHPPQYMRTELPNSCCTFSHIKTLVTPKHMACPGEKCKRGGICVYETTSKT